MNKSKMKNKVAIVGYGYVGKAMHKIFPDAYVYDIKFMQQNAAGFEELNADGAIAVAEGVSVTTMDVINDNCGLAIVCVPTPMQESNGEFKAVDTSMVESAVAWLQTDLILIKSTVPPRTVDRLVKETGKNICFSPEYIGEGKYQITPWRYMSQTDPRTHEFVIIGGQPGIRDAVCDYFVQQLGPEKQYYLIDAVEAEIIKYMENSWGAMKVIFAQEFYELCKALGASYHRVREGWALDNRVERMHTSVFVNNQGFAGKCYPKDLNGIVAAADDVGVDMSMIKTALRKNSDIRKV